MAIRQLEKEKKWPPKLELRENKYLNNIVEQDHRFIKKRMKASLGFRSFEGAEATIAGVELHRMLKKNQAIIHNEKPVYEQFYLLAA